MLQSEVTLTITDNKYISVFSMGILHFPCQLQRSFPLADFIVKLNEIGLIYIYIYMTDGHVLDKI